MRRKSRWSGWIPSRRCCKTFCLSPFSINSSRHGLSVRESERSGCLRGAQRAECERPAARLYSPRTTTSSYGFMLALCRQVVAEEAGAGRGGIADGGRCSDAAAKTLQSLSSCSHIHHRQQHYRRRRHHTGRRVHDGALSSAAPCERGALTLTRQQRESRRGI